MFDIFNKEKKLKNKLKLEEDLSCVLGDMKISVNVEDLLRMITDAENRKYTYVAQVINKLLTDYFVEMFNDDNYKEKLISEHKKLIDQGIFDIINNAEYFYQQEMVVLRDLVAYITDIFINKNERFLSLSVKDLVDCLEKRKSWKEIRSFELNKDFFKTDLRQEQLNDSISMLKDLSQYVNKEKCLIENLDYNGYDLTKSFDDNLKCSTLNYEEIKGFLIKNKIKIFIDNELKISKELEIGKYLDFKSVCWESIYLLVNEVDSRYSVELMKTMNSYKLYIYDTVKKECAPNEIYEKVISIIE